MGKQHKKKPVNPAKREMAEGVAGYLLTLKRRPGLQDLSRIPQKTASDRDDKDTEVRRYQKRK